MAETIEFLAEVKKTSSKKLASLDMEYSAVLSSTDLGLYSLGELPADVIIKVTCEVME